MMIKLFNQNEKGFVKNKEMKINEKKPVFGLNQIKIDSNSSKSKGPAFDVLFGE